MKDLILFMKSFALAFCTATWFLIAISLGILATETSFVWSFLLLFIDIIWFSVGIAFAFKWVESE